MENMLEALAAFLVTVASWFTTLLHFMGLVNPNKQLAAGAGAGAAVAAGSSTPGKTGLEQVEAAAERISDRMEHLLKVRQLGEGGGCVAARVEKLGKAAGGTGGSRGSGSTARVTGELHVGPCVAGAWPLGARGLFNMYHTQTCVYATGYQTF
jgi:hypothetical protein